MAFENPYLSSLAEALTQGFREEAQRCKQDPRYAQHIQNQIDIIRHESAMFLRDHQGAQARALALIDQEHILYR